MTQRFLVSMLALMVLGSIAPSQAAPSSEDYVAGFMGDVTGLCEGETPAAINIGATCHKVTPGERYRVQIADAVTGEHVGYQWSFDDADGVCVGSDPDDPLSDCPNAALTCGTTVVTAPPKAVTLEILLDGFAFGPLDCLVDGPGDSAGIATVGTVTVTKL